MKNTLIINGHPDKESLCGKLAENYFKGTKKTNNYSKLVHLIDLEFDPILRHGYHKRTELEPDLLNLQEEIKNADHLVFVYPNWWGTYPALMKAFIDRVFLPKFAFSYKENSLLWNKLLKGKSARLIVTMDTPKWYYSIIHRKPGHNSMKKGILNFTGVKPVKITTFSPVKSSDIHKREKWLSKVYDLGAGLN